MFILQSNLKRTKKALKLWNKSSFGHVQTNIKQLTNLIESIQSLPFTSSNLSCEADAQLELNDLLAHEATLWRDKSRSA